MTSQITLSSYSAKKPQRLPTLIDSLHIRNKLDAFGAESKFHVPKSLQSMAIPILIQAKYNVEVPENKKPIAEIDSKILGKKWKFA